MATEYAPPPFGTPREEWSEDQEGEWQFLDEFFYPRLYRSRECTNMSEDDLWRLAHKYRDYYFWTGESRTAFPPGEEDEWDDVR